ncbi:hypothetical protein I4U23_004025 [Adineta vaga]|nr:hypothetical protein I4U23_004025 [Adineta vaga]
MGIFLFGMIGNILNTLVLSQRQLRLNPCSWLFLVSSIFCLISLCSSLIPRVLSTWNADITNTNDILCKLRVFIYYNSMTIAFWLIALVTIDRWLSSSMNVNYRHKSTLKNAKRGMLAIIIISTMIQTQQIFCYKANLIHTPLKCYTKAATCGILSDLTFALITIVIPLVLMFIFGLKIISNVRQTQARLRPIAAPIVDKNANRNPALITVVERPNQQRKTDHHLLIMLLVQVLVILVCTVPFALSKFYLTFTRDTPRSLLQNTIEDFIFNLFLLFLNVACGMPFYIYTLTGGTLFRKALFKLFHR